MLPSFSTLKKILFLYNNYLKTISIFKYKRLIVIIDNKTVQIHNCNYSHIESKYYNKKIAKTMIDS